MKLSISTTRRETLLGWSYLLISMFALPFALGFLNAFLEKPMSDTVIHLAYLWVNFAAVTVIFRQFLIASVKLAADNAWRCLRFAAFGLGLYYFLSILVSQAVVWIQPEFSNVNDNALMDLFQ